MANYSSPGVYIVEENAFPNSAVAVETAIPAFIGYTFKAERAGKSLIRIPTKINSFAEYIESFGGAFKPSFLVQKKDSAGSSDHITNLKSVQEFKLGTQDYTLCYEEDHELYFYNSIRLFYANGGSSCVILSIGTYGDPGDNSGKTQGIKVSDRDFKPSDELPESPFDLLKNEPLPTLIVIPDIIVLGKAAYDIYQQVLIHCSAMQSCFVVFDLRNHSANENPDAVLEEFRTSIGTNFLNYGAAYYPWLNTVIVDADELTFENLPESLSTFLEAELAEIFVNYQNEKTKLEAQLVSFRQDKKDYDQTKLAIFNLNKTHHLALKSSSPFYRMLLNQARDLFNKMPACGAMVGLYTMVDNTRGVWKAPANYSLNSVKTPTVKISSEAQQCFNIDIYTGKSINVILPFEGIGTLVWGARTLDGNSQDWRYINVRRTLIMIEQSIKAALRAYVFEPNNANTWLTVKSMVNTFLTNLWKQGALAGANPEQAFDVQIGLGSTMTPTDILDGKMLITLKVAIVRPAEFIVVTFQQQLQQS
ncbi:phage tail sheath family protein [Pedobacter gandavensis]|uniref:phage tail sheath family protein n=1 Tax=Pedobacter gandavensis TaxID=2679963 RepID=UPI00292FAB69|nr:phage tail sheath C-terminal domain-containing protein [Pedobacter gandavensis]